MVGSAGGGEVGTVKMEIRSLAKCVRETDGDLVTRPGLEQRARDTAVECKQSCVPAAERDRRLRCRKVRVKLRVDAPENVRTWANRPLAHSGLRATISKVPGNAANRGSAHRANELSSINHVSGLSACARIVAERRKDGAQRSQVDGGSTCRVDHGIKPAPPFIIDPMTV